MLCNKTIMSHRIEKQDDGDLDHNHRGQICELQNRELMSAVAKKTQPRGTYVNEDFSLGETQRAPTKNGEGPRGRKDHLPVV